MELCYELIIESDLEHIPVINTSLTLGSIGVNVINYFIHCKA